MYYVIIFVFYVIKKSDWFTDESCDTQKWLIERWKKVNTFNNEWNRYGHHFLNLVFQKVRWDNKSNKRIYWKQDTHILNIVLLIFFPFMNLALFLIDNKNYY